ncbi:hypothetical protein CCAX7_14360 [Capsulimonas corticalis]|uniref:Uncharacterized protein n=1 Tax=Capsulimonas corticalis TaxID=2219043 RepID=A0A402D759_9BACT|nr:hypothetical protein [Capsulimonas corticalis]BDI29385.1 hypothetical protein CCAX7_14360 [Capsulimonas corticalis]
MNLNNVFADAKAQAAAYVQAQLLINPKFSQETLTSGLIHQGDKFIALAAAKARISPFIVALILPLANAWLSTQANSIYAGVVAKLAQAAPADTTAAAS